MKKILSSLALSLVLSTLVANLAFAEDVSGMVIETVGTSSSLSGITGVETFVNGSLYTVTVSTEAKATGAFVDVWTSVSGGTANAAVAEANAQFLDLKKALGEYGKLSRTSIATYADTQESLTVTRFTSNLSARIVLNDLSSLATVQAWLNDHGMTANTTVTVESITTTEKAAAPAIKAAMTQEEATLGDGTGRRTGLQIWSSVNAESYNSVTGMVNVDTAVTVFFGTTSSQPQPIDFAPSVKGA